MAQQPQNQEKPATTLQVKQLIRKILKKQPPHEEMSLNIYPMMDMMTILLVFMIMSFSASAASITESNELRLPLSLSQVQQTMAVTVTISETSIMVDNKVILPLRNRVIDPGYKQQGGNGFLINPLLATMKLQRESARVREQLTRQPFDANVQILADKDTPFRTVMEVVYTCGQAEFKNVRFVAVKPAPETK